MGGNTLDEDGLEVGTDVDYGCRILSKAVSSGDPYSAPLIYQMSVGGGGAACSKYDLVTILSNGTINPADANTGVIQGRADGIALEAIGAPGSGKVAFGFCIIYDTHSSLNGVSAGDELYLSGTAGAKTTTPPSASGDIVQRIGKVMVDWDGTGAVVLYTFDFGQAEVIA